MPVSMAGVVAVCRLAGWAPQYLVTGLVVWMALLQRVAATAENVTSAWGTLCYDAGLESLVSTESGDSCRDVNGNIASIGFVTTMEGDSHCCLICPQGKFANSASGSCSDCGFFESATEDRSSCRADMVVLVSISIATVVVSAIGLCCAHKPGHVPLWVMILDYVKGSEWTFDNCGLLVRWYYKFCHGAGVSSTYPIGHHTLRCDINNEHGAECLYCKTCASERSERSQRSHLSAALAPAASLIGNQAACLEIEAADPARTEVLLPGSLLREPGSEYTDMIILARASRAAQLEHIHTLRNRNEGRDGAQLVQRGQSNSSSKNGPLLIGVPRGLPNFVGRSDVLGRIADALTPDGPTALSQAVGTGMGGVGKTSLAIQYIHTFGMNYDAIFWVRAEHPESLESDFKDIGKALHHSGTAEEIPKHLETLRTKWLLVLDNVESRASIKPWLPQAGGAILVTTRRRDWETHIDVDCFTRGESLLYFEKILSQRQAVHDDPDAFELCRLLGDLPLAVALAAAYMRRCGSSFKDYLVKQREYYEDLENWHAGKRPLDNYELTVTATLRRTIEKISQASCAAGEISLACCYLNPDHISRHVVERMASLHKPCTADSVIADMWEFSILTESAESVYSMHRLLQRAGQSMARAHGNAVLHLVSALYGAVYFSARYGGDDKRYVHEVNEESIDHMTYLVEHVPPNPEVVVAAATTLNIDRRSLVGILSSIDEASFWMGAFSQSSAYACAAARASGDSAFSIVWKRVDSVEGIGRNNTSMEVRCTHTLYQVWEKYCNNFVPGGVVSINFVIFYHGRVFVPHEMHKEAVLASLGIRSGSSLRVYPFMEPATDANLNLLGKWRRGGEVIENKKKRRYEKDVELLMREILYDPPLPFSVFRIELQARVSEEVVLHVFDTMISIRPLLNYPFEPPVCCVVQVGRHTLPKFVDGANSCFSFEGWSPAEGLTVCVQYCCAWFACLEEASNLIT